ncbi:DUF6612 family protein [Sporolactobacillus pectinivorans]|uniref:DUF6612 family protein n=1 Tax=Sporolactobacillus pectinivorans TaxID=1591408 RepID=UPI000C25B828|nr:DUF6612 family protein [Sporolactobacillus pectinivorans]
MKLKWFPVFFLLYALVLSGCSAAGLSNRINSGMIIQKAVSQSEKIKNSNSDLTVDFFIKTGRQSISSKVTAKGQVSSNPLFLHQHYMSVLNGKQSIQIEAYLNKNDIYVKSDLLPTAAWISMGLNQADNSGLSLIKESFQQMNSGTQIKLLQKFIKNIQIKESANDYSINFTGDQNAIKQFAMEIVRSNMDNQQAQSVSAAVNNMKITKLDYSYVVDKKTFYPKSYNSAIKITGAENGQSIDISVTVSGSFSKINQLNDLSLPATVRSASRIN